MRASHLLVGATKQILERLTLYLRFVNLYQIYKTSCMDMWDNCNREAQLDACLIYKYLKTQKTDMRTSHLLAGATKQILEWLTLYLGFVAHKLANKII